MEEMKFVLPCRAFSINSAYYATKKIKTRDCKDWEDMVLRHLRSLQHSGSIVAPVDFIGEVEIWIDIYYPASVYWTKQHTISAKTMDVTNTEKLLVDVIFGSFLHINDKFIRKMHSAKHPGSAYAIEVKLKFYSYGDTDSSASLGSGTDE